MATSGVTGETLVCVQQPRGAAHAWVPIPDIQPGALVVTMDSSCRVNAVQSDGVEPTGHPILNNCRCTLAVQRKDSQVAQHALTCTPYTEVVVKAYSDARKAVTTEFRRAERLRPGQRYPWRARPAAPSACREWREAVAAAKHQVWGEMDLVVAAAPAFREPKLVKLCSVSAETADPDPQFFNLRAGGLAVLMRSSPECATAVWVRSLGA